MWIDITWYTDALRPIKKKRKKEKMTLNIDYTPHPKTNQEACLMKVLWNEEMSQGGLKTYFCQIQTWKIT